MSVYESTRKMKPAEQECFDLSYKKGLQDAVVHGRWLSSLNYCSVCNQTYIDRTKYCPNCGAKMDLQEVESDA